MKDQYRTKQSLLEELTYLRQRVADLERSEKECRHTEDSLRFAMETSQMGAWDLDLVDHSAFRSLEHDRIFGYADLLPCWTYEMFLEHVLPEDRTMVDRKFQHAIAIRSDWNFECRIRRTDGEVRWIWAAGRHKLNAAGEIHRMAGMVQDITDRKRVEEKLQESEGRYKRLLDSVTDYIYTVQIEDGRPIATSHGLGCTAVTGYTSEDYQADPYLWHHMVYAQDQDPVTEQAARVIAGETVAAIEHRIVHRDGSVRWVRNTPVPHYDERRRLVAYDGLISNITERKKAEEQVKTAALYARSLIEAALDPLVTIGKDGKITDVNRAIEDATGLCRDDLIGSDFSCYFTEPEKAKEGYQKVFDEGIVRNYLLRLVHATGRTTDVLYNASVYRDADGEIQGVFAAARDITEHKRLEEERLEMERRLLHAQRLESLGVLAGGIAHDFNNLLMMILGNLEMTRMELPPSSTISPFIEASLDATIRAVDITRQMLAYSGKGGFMLKPVDLTLLVEAMKAMLMISISKTAVLRLDLTPHLPSVMADAGQMQQIILNLIINASEAIGEKTGVVILRAGVLECDDVYLGHSRLEEKPPSGRFTFIEVSDTGCGMDEETQDRLFDPFFTTKFPGRGIGMSALLGIVRGHNGAIMVDSEAGKGTTISVLFPALAAENREQKFSIEPASTPPEKAALPVFSGTALLVDDEVGLRNLCKTILERFGFRVLTASDGEECIKVFSAHADEITCVILDLTMPMMDGAVAFIELNRLRPDVPVILSSGYDKTEATQRFSGKGTAGFIKKPYNISDLRSELERVLKSVK